MSSEEVDRVARVYRRYREDPGRRRAWSSVNAGNRMIRAELARTALTAATREIHRARAILDVGCGTGWWLERLAAEPAVSAKLYGVDILEERIVSARARVPAAELAVADARGLPLPDGCVDVVTLFTVLSSLAGGADAARALAEARRVLAPDGVALVWEPRVANPANRATHLVSPALVRRAFCPLSVQIVTLTLLPPLARRLGRFADQAYPWLVRLPALRTHRLFVVRRSAGAERRREPLTHPR